MPTVEKLLGKIASIHFGLGGYQDVQLGLSISLEGKNWGADTFIGIWDYFLYSISNRISQMD